MEVGDGNSGAGDRFAVGFIGNGTGEGTKIGWSICEKQVIIKNANKREEGCG